MPDTLTLATRGGSTETATRPNRTSRLLEAPGRLRSRWPLRAPGPGELADLAVVTIFVALACVVLLRQWKALGTGYLSVSGQDQTMWEWFFAVAAHSLVHLQNPLSSDLQNAPLGVNLMGNTAMFGVSIPLAPITLLFGPAATFTLALTAGLAGTAIAWYWVLHRHLVRSRFAAAVGGAICGFAPAMISHANGHPNFVALFLLPFIAVRVIRLGSGLRPVRDGVVLGLLIAGQVLLGEEPLLIYAITFAVFGLVFAAARPGAAFASAKRGVRGLVIAGAVALVLTAVPLWWQFLGPQSYRALEHGPVGNDVSAFAHFPTESLAGTPDSAVGLRMNGTEENAFFGWPLLLLTTITAVWLRRVPLARAAAGTAAVMGVLSLGVELSIGRAETGIPLPWALLAKLPLLNSVLESRFAMGCIPAIALLVAMGTDRALALGREGSRSTMLLWLGWLAVAIVPLAPVPLDVAPRTPAPAFFADGTWRGYVGDGTVVTVPLPSPENARMLRWQTEQNFAFRIAGGYFVGPAGADKHGKYGPDDRPTATLLAAVQKTGVVPTVDDTIRDTARKDLKFWHADVLVLVPGQHDAQLFETVRQLTGVRGERVDGVWVWDVRGRA